MSWCHSHQFWEAVHEHHRRSVRGPGVGDVNCDTAAYVYEPVLDALECRN